MYCIWIVLCYMCRVMGESLLVPKLNPEYYAYIQTAYDCDCPTSTDLTQTGEPYGTHFTDAVGVSMYMEYSGASKCMRTTSYTDVHEGVVWTGTVLPEFSIEQVNLTFEYMERSSGRVERWASCDFIGREEYLYTVSW